MPVSLDQILDAFSIMWCMTLKYRTAVPGDKSRTAVRSTYQRPTAWPSTSRTNMNGAPQPPDIPEPDLIDRIANALPAEFQADYYREMRHCRSLFENDEMLRILRAMQFSVVLMVQIPERMAAERQRLGQIIADFLTALREIRQSIASYQAQLDQRLVHLPAEIAEGINPQTVAALINESLRQQFVQSTIPATAEALAVAAAQMKRVTSEFARSALFKEFEIRRGSKSDPTGLGPTGKKTRALGGGWLELSKGRPMCQSPVSSTQFRSLTDFETSATLSSNLLHSRTSDEESALPRTLKILRRYLSSEKKQPSLSSPP